MVVQNENLKKIKFSRKLCKRNRSYAPNNVKNTICTYTTTMYWTIFKNYYKIEILLKKSINGSLEIIFYLCLQQI